MQKKLLLIGDIGGDDDYFSSACQKIFSSTPDMIKNAADDSDVLLRAEQLDMVFIRIDQDYTCNFALSGKIKSAFPHVRVVWIAANNRYALPAFENNLDGYFELPVTEAKLGAVKMRLDM